MNPKLQYVVVEVHALFEDVSTTPGDVKKRFGNVLKEQKKPFLIVASDLLSTLEGKWGVKLHVKKILMGSDLENYRLQTEIETLSSLELCHANLIPSLTIVYVIVHAKIASETTNLYCSK